jgi:hypothetical protein
VAKRVRRKPEMLFPLIQVTSLAPKLDLAIPPSIVVLLGSRCPTDIAGFVVTVVVDTV